MMTVYWLIEITDLKLF